MRVQGCARCAAGRGRCWRGRPGAGQYCLVKPLSISLLTFPQRHARNFVDKSFIRFSCFHFSGCLDIFSPWVKPRLAWRLFQVRV